MNEDLPESGWEHVPGHLGGTVTDVGHFVHALEAPPHPVVNTLGTPPVLLDLVIPVALGNKHVWSLGCRKFCFKVAFNPAYLAATICNSPPEKNHQESIKILC